MQFSRSSDKSNEIILYSLEFGYIFTIIIFNCNCNHDYNYVIKIKYK